MSEAILMRQIQVAVSKVGARIFRNNSALAWAGAVVKINTIRNITVGPGDVVIRNARPIHAGLCEGSSDLIGWQTKKITPDMVGLSVAIFTAVEVKTKKGKSSQQQVQFLEAVKSAGGIAVIARSVEEAVGGLSGFEGS